MTPRWCKEKKSADVNPEVSSGDLDTTFTQNTGMNNTVKALALAGGSLYVGGDFTAYRGLIAPYLAKMNLNSGDLDTTFT